MNEGPQQSWLARVANAGRVVEDALIVVLLGGLILFSSAQILLRNLFSIGFTWGDGLTRLAVLWLALLGAPVAAAGGCASTPAAAALGVVAWAVGLRP